MPSHTPKKRAKNVSKAKEKGFVPFKKKAKSKRKNNPGTIKKF